MHENGAALARADDNRKDFSSDRRAATDAERLVAAARGAKRPRPRTPIAWTRQRRGVGPGARPPGCCSHAKATANSDDARVAKAQVMRGLPRRRRSFRRARRKRALRATVPRDGSTSVAERENAASSPFQNRLRARGSVLLSGRRKYGGGRRPGLRVSAPLSRPRRWFPPGVTTSHPLRLRARFNKLDIEWSRQVQLARPGFALVASIAPRRRAVSKPHAPRSIASM
jgi:hypothetical protein